MIKKYRDLKVFQLSYRLAMEIFELTKGFPKEEVYSLTDQIRRSSRSIPSNIGEGWARRKYENIFIKHLKDATGSCEETKIWLSFAKDCNYIKDEEYDRLANEYNKIGAMLHSLINKWKTF